MDRGRNLEALAEEDDEEEMEEEHRDSDGSESSTTDDDAPDEGIKRGEPNKFDILCDGVTNSMALVHTALEELLDMKDEMLRHQLPPTLLIKLATNTGKVFRSISDLNMPVNELLRLVRVYSTPWEEKSAALKKLHEDYEAKQRQLNIAIKRLQLVDAHSKRIAREKRVMNWEKLFSKVMSHKGHGRRWKFLIDTIKQKAKLGLEHVQEFTKQLDESSDEEEDEMPTIQLKRHDGASPTSTSDKVSEAETEQGEEESEEKDEKEEGSEAGSDGEKEPGLVTEVPSIKIGEAEEEEEDEDEEVEEGSDKRSRSAESSKKVRFAEVRQSPKVETKDAEVWTHEPDHETHLFVRMYCPTNMNQTDVKCSVTMGKKYFKTKRLDEDDKPPSGDLTPMEVKKGRFEETSFILPPTVPQGVWPGKTPAPAPPKNFQISINTGPKDSLFAMATIEIEDLKALDLKVIDLPPVTGDDDVPKVEETKPDDDLDSLASDFDIPLPDDEKTEQEFVDRVKDVEPMMFPLYSLDGSSAMHKPCGNLPLIVYWGKKPQLPTFNRQCGTHGVNELVFEMTGIDMQTTSKADLHKEMVDDSTSVINFAPTTTDRALSALRLTPEAEPPVPPASPEQESIPEEIPTDVKEPTPEPEPEPEPEIKPEPEPVVEEPKEEMITKVEYDKVVEKHSKDMLFIQEEYEKQLQKLVQNLQQMEQSQQLQQQQLQKQQQQIQVQQKELAKRPGSSHFQTPASTGPPPLSATKRVPVSEDVGKPVIHAPMPPQKPKTKGPRKKQPPPERTWDGVPDEFMDRLQYFEEVSYRHKQDLVDRVKQDVQEDIEKKLAGQHKLSKKEEAMFEALNDVSLPALFMPYHRGTVFNPRAHQYFHPNGSTDLRLTQPPSVFQLPPLHRSSTSVLNLFELSKNFNTRGPPGWLMDRYIQQQEPIKNAHGIMPQASVPTSQLRSPPYTPQPTYDMPSTRGGEEPRPRQLETEAEC